VIDLRYESCETPICAGERDSKSHVARAAPLKHRAFKSACQDVSFDVRHKLRTCRVYASIDAYERSIIHE